MATGHLGVVPNTVGPTGPQGTAGGAGPTGATGPASTVAGPTGAQGAAGAVGPTGPQGTQGAQGEQGIQGTQGAAGPTGPTGQTGAASTVAGPTGPAGPTGDAGAQGSAGPAGPTGPQGAQGAQGTQGVAGPTGPTGPQGTQGTQGIQGTAGPTGPTGPQGIQGNVGDTGPAGSGTGDVIGPASATDNAIARYDGTTGKLIQNSGATIDDAGNIAANNLSGTNTGDQTLAGFGITSSAAELNILDGVTATAAELNALDGITATVAELNFTDGVTSAIQAQLDGKQPLDSDLTTIAGLTATTDNVIQSVASAWASRTPAQLKATLALAKGDVGLGNVDNTSDAAKNAATATLTNKTLTAPTIADFTNMAHDHLDADDGGTLSAAAIASGTVATARLGSGTADSTTYLRGDQTWATPAGGGAGALTDVLTGTTTWNPPNLAFGGTSSTTVTVTGAATGDHAVAFLSTLTTQAMVLNAYVSAANTVTVTLASLSNYDLGSGTLRATVFKY